MPSHEQLLTFLEGATDLQGEQLVDSLLEWGEFAEFTSDQEQIVYFGRCVEIARKANQRWLEIEMLRELSSPYRHLDSINKSFDCLYTALELAVQYEPASQAKLYHKLAYNYLHYHDYVSADEQFIKASKLAHEAGDYRRAGSALLSRVETIYSLGDLPWLDRAVKRYYDYVTTHRKSRVSALAEAESWLGILAELNGDNERARSQYELAYQSIKKLDSQEKTANIVLLRVVNGKTAFTAEEYLSTILYIDGLDIDWYPYQIRELRIKEAESYLKLGQASKAAALLEQLPMSHDVAGPNLLPVMRLLEQTHVALKDYASAYGVRRTLDSLETAYYKTRDELRFAYAEARLNLDAANAALASLEKENTAISQAATLRSYLAVLIGIILLLVAIGAFYFYQQMQKRAEGEAQLQKRVNEQTGSLRQQNEELKHFNTVLSHDLKEPLRSVVSFSNLAARVNQDDRVGEYLHYVSTSGHQLHRLVGDILTYQNEPTVDAPQCIQLAELCATCFSEVHQEHAPRCAEIELAFNREVMASPVLLADCIRSVMENALRFNESACARITLRYEERDGQHCLYIADNGIGIATEYHEHVFTLFKRLHVREAYVGSGLGLARVRKLMAAVDGSASVAASTPGEGTTVRLSWPVLPLATSSPARSMALAAQVS